jgi:uncharacterized protein
MSELHANMVYVPKDDQGPPEKPLQLHAFKKQGALMAVLLKEREGERILPISVGLDEGNAIAQHLAEVATPRPMTYDFMAKLLEVGKQHIERVAVTKLHDRTYYATLWVRAGDRVHEIDARPSDAINLALRMQAPIFIEPEAFARGSPTPESVRPELQAVYASITTTSLDTAMELRSFRALL